jgi:CheY-like chemotaxis protein
MAYRILVVDDDASVREVLTAFLGQEGHRVETAKNGLEALEVLAGRSYDVILSDLRMPGMGGEDLYRRIERGWPHLAPRVVMSAQKQSRGFQTQYGGAPVPILTKPFTLGQLRQVIARLIARDV